MTVRIESLDHEGRGVAHVDGKAVFIDGALPGELVEQASYRKKPNFELAQITKMVRESALRVRPKCPHFGVCGGCAMQHLEHSAQVAAKQRILEDNLARIGKVRPERILPAIYGAPWEYRQRARLSARYVNKKGGALVGFREKKSSFVADMSSCAVLPAHVSALLVPLRDLINALSIRERLPQIEVAVGEHVTILVLRVLEPPSPADEAVLRAFADQHRIQLWLQSKGPDTAVPFYPMDAPDLAYSLPEFGIVMPFKPTEFTQVNLAINRLLVKRTVDLLAPQPGERVIDLFCGLGNFSLPIARRGASVLGIEGAATLVARASENARYNRLESQVEFRIADLFQVTESDMAAWGHCDKMLIDPPRDGAMEVVKALGEDAPARIVYVSCNPATLARDAEVLVHAKGYVLRAAGVVNMFPHTAHVESMALFEKG